MNSNLSMKKALLADTALSDPRWTAVQSRCAEADAMFYYAVKTTGVYCRPSCAARLARPENVRFFETREEAERAGFRPCRRCQPDRPSLAEQYAGKITCACRIIEKAEIVPGLEMLAGRVGMSASHFHRVFRQLTGLTPRQYAVARRGERMRDELGHGGAMTDAIFNAGYGASSRFYVKSGEVLGMTPARYRAGGVDTGIRFAVGECSLGSILVAQNQGNLGICAILLGDDPEKLVRDLQDSFPRADLIGADADFEHLVAKVVGFVEAPGIALESPGASALLRLCGR